MNPEEGQLRPQIMDLFGLRVVVKGLEDKTQRLQAYERAHRYLENPWQIKQEFTDETQLARQEIQAAREILPAIKISRQLTTRVLDLIHALKIDSLRAEITLFEAARAFTA